MQIPEHHCTPREAESLAEEHQNPYFKKAPQVTLMHNDVGVLETHTSKLPSDLGAWLLKASGHTLPWRWQILVAII